MERRRGKRKQNRLPPFVALTWSMLNHQAYKDLPPSAGKILPYFLGKVQGLAWGDPERYTRAFEFSYPEAAKLGYSPGTFSKIINDLMRYGYIEPINKGGLRGFGKSTSKFTLSEKWERYQNRDGKRLYPGTSWREFVPDHRTR